MLVLGTMTGDRLIDMGDVTAIPPASTSPYPNANVVFGISPGNHPPNQVRPCRTPLVNLPMPGETPPNWRASIPAPAYSALNKMQSDWSSPDVWDATQSVASYEAQPLMQSLNQLPASQLPTNQSPATSTTPLADTIKQHLPLILSGLMYLLF